MNEVERLFQEQQAASDRARNPEADVRSAQTIMDQHESMNAAESLFQANQPAPFAEHNTEKQTRTVQRMLNIAIFLKVIPTALEICAYRFPKVPLALMDSSLKAEDAAGILNSPLLLLSPLLSFGIVLLFYYLLSKQNRQTTDACTPLMILTVLMPLITSVINVPLGYFLTHWVSKMLNSESYGAYSVIRTAVSLVAFISAPVVPMLAAAAGMICCRWKRNEA